MDVHKESISIAVMNGAGKIVMECVIETKASMILQFIDGPYEISTFGFLRLSLFDRFCQDRKRRIIPLLFVNGFEDIIATHFLQLTAFLLF